MTKYFFNKSTGQFIQLDNVSDNAFNDDWILIQKQAFDALLSNASNHYANPKVKLTNKEITDQIYDTPSGNGGISQHHVCFNPVRITQGEVNPDDGVIVFELDEGKKNIQIVISDAPKNYFTQE